MPKRCPHPKKLRWPIDDQWGPWVKACEINRWASTSGEASVMGVYRCGGLTGDHWHLTDEAKAEAKHRAFLERTGRVLSQPTTTQPYREMKDAQDPDHDRARARAARRRRVQRQRQVARERGERERRARQRHRQP